MLFRTGSTREWAAGIAARRVAPSPAQRRGLGGSASSRQGKRQLRFERRPIAMVAK